MNEIWRNVPGYQGFYAVSNLGNVKSLGNNKTRKDKIKKHQVLSYIHKNRIYKQHRVSLFKNGEAKWFFVSRLVWSAFNGDIPNGMQIDHIDNNPENNFLQNLQLLTRSENIKKTYKDNPELKNNYNKGLPKKPIICLETGIKFKSINDCKKRMGLSDGYLYSRLSGKIKSNKGYHFQYIP